MRKGAGAQRNERVPDQMRNFMLDEASSTKKARGGGDWMDVTF